MFHVVQQLNAANNQLVPILGTPQPLQPSSIRARTCIISLTTNNITYTKSNLLGWWNAYYIPDSVRSDFPTSQFMHAPGRGFAEIEQSTIADIEPGDWIFGYIPYSTHCFDLSLHPAEAKGHYVEVSPQRNDLVRFYNRYHVLAKAELTRISADDLEFTSLMRALFGTGYDLANFVFAPKPEERVRPTDQTFEHEWSEKDGDLEEATVVVLGAAGKAALAFAHQLKHGRAPAARPHAIIAVTSNASAPIVRRCGLYDVCYRYGDASTAIGEARIAGHEGKKFVIVDFGSQPDAGYDWAQVMQDLTQTPVVHVCLTDVPRSGTNAVLALGPHITALAIDRIGGEEYFRRYDAAFESLARERQKLGMEVVRKEGLEAFQQDFSDLAEGKSLAGSGFVYHL